MRFLVVSSLWPPHSRGGTELVAHRQARLLEEAGHEVVAVTSSRPGEPRYLEHGYGGLKVIRYRPWNVGTVFDLPNFYLPRRLLWHVLDAANVSSARIFEGIVRKERPHVVLSHGLKDLGYLLPRAARRAGAKTVHTLHDVQLIEPSGVAETDVRPTAARRVWSAYARACFGSPDAVLFPSAWLMRTSDAWGFFPRSRKRVVRNPVVPSPRAAARPVRTVLFLGQLEPHKGVRELLHAARGIAPEFRLLMVGDGRLAAHVQAEAERNPRVRYLGRRDGERLAQAWSEADLVIVPSICAENAPNVIQEAAAHGTLVIASRIGGIPELVQEGETGWLVPPGDADALRDAIAARLGTVVTDGQRAAMAGLADDWSAKRYVREILETVRAI